MQVRFKDGLPLMVGGQMIAGSQTCCCENPPPPACYCPDFCSYFIEVVSPSSLAVKSPTAVCSSDYFTSDVILFDYEFSDIIFGPGWSYYDGGQIKALSGAGNYLPLGFLQASVYHGVAHNYDDPPTGGCAHSIFIELRASISVFCGNDSGFIPGERDPSIVPMLQVQYTASFLRNNRNNFGCVQECWPQLRYDKIIRLPADCFYNSDRACPEILGVLDPRSGLRYIQTPLDITVEYGGVTVGGEFFPNTDTVSDPCGPDPVFGEDFRTFINSTVDRHAATFRITARPSCRSVPADCDVPLEGNRIIYFGTATDRDFVLGTPKSTTTGPISGGVTVNYEHYGTASGTTADPWVFNAKIVRDEDNRTIEEHNVELFCGLDESVSPAVSRWYIREYTYCTPEFGQQTTGQWISVVESYTASNDCNGIAVGDPVPIGSPDYEEVDGYPVVDFGDPCVPPAPIGLEITDLCP